MYDTSLIKQRISCVDVAQRCGLPIQRSGDRCVSPLRQGATNSSSFCVDDDFWYDFGSGSGGDAIDLLALLKHSGDRGAAIRELATITGVPDNNPRPDGWYTYTQNLCNQVAFWQTQLTREDYNYLHSRGLTDDTISALKIGRTEDGRLSIPYMKNGYVAYYCTRHLPGGAYPDSKYRKQKRDDYCEHIIWGLDSLTRDSDTLVIAEGAFDAISFWQENYPVLSAITGFFSKSQIPTLLAAARRFSKVFIVYDDDSKTSNAGARFTMRTAELLTRNRIPFVVGTVPPPYHDISEYYAAGGDLQRIITTAEPGISYIASQFSEFSDLEKFVYTVARHTKRTQLDELFSQLRSSRRWDSDALKSLHKSAITAPPENIVADEILAAHQLVYIPAVGFYEYNNGVWSRLSDEVIQSYADKTLGEFSTYQRVKAITGLMKTRAQRSDIAFDRQPMWNFINGTLELETGNFREHNPNDYCSVQSSYPYNPNATYSTWARFIDDITAGDPRSAELLQLIPGYVFDPTNKYEKIFVLTGAGGNGKSKYLAILRQLFGDSHVSYLKPKDLLKDFKLIQLKDSFVNIAGEIRSELLEVEEAMKSVASGEPQTACYKGKDFVNFVPRSKLIYACNGQLSSGDTSDGLTRRLIMVDFKVSFVDNPDPSDPYQRLKNVDILDSLNQELNSGGIFNWAYEGYKLLRMVGYFTETTDQQSLIQDFKRSSNPILVFWEESEHRPAEYDYQQAYADYSQWCGSNGYKPVTSQKFHSEYRKVSSRYYEPDIRSVRIDGKPRKQRFYRLRTTF
jgi:putative DNA primase/helicase